MVVWWVLVNRKMNPSGSIKGGILLLHSVLQRLGVMTVLELNNIFILYFAFNFLIDLISKLDVRFSRRQL
jgi:hypothetical protein